MWENEERQWFALFDRILFRWLWKFRLCLGFRCSYMYAIQIKIILNWLEHLWTICFKQFHNRMRNFFLSFVPLRFCHEKFIFPFLSILISVRRIACATFSPFDLALTSDQLWTEEMPAAKVHKSKLNYKTFCRVSLLLFFISNNGLKMFVVFAFNFFADDSFSVEYTIPRLYIQPILPLCFAHSRTPHSHKMKWIKF